jgi:hypothetical protein
MCFRVEPPRDARCLREETVELNCSVMLRHLFASAVVAFSLCACKSKPVAYDGEYDFNCTAVSSKSRSSYRVGGKAQMLVTRTSGQNVSVSLLGCTFDAKPAATPGVFDIVPADCFLAVPSGQNHKQKYDGQLQMVADSPDASLALTVTNGWGTTTFAFRGQRPKS